MALRSLERTTKLFVFAREAIASHVVPPKTSSVRRRQRRRRPGDRVFGGTRRRSPRARCSCLLCSSQGAIAGASPGAPSRRLELDEERRRPAPPTERRLHRRRSFPTPSKRKRRQVRRFARAGEAETYEPARAGRRTHQCTNWVSRHRVIVRSPTMWNGLLRKEVIQPHLPVRLPCYDFTPITDPTFDGSLSCELGHRLRVLPTFVV